MFRKKFIYSVGIIVLFAFFFRYQVSVELLNNDSFVLRPPSGTDMATYMRLASEIVSGRFSDLFYYQPFYYAVFLPTIYFFTGKSIFAVIIVQAILSTLTVLLSVLSAKLLFGRKASLITGFLCCFSTVLILYVPYHLIETLQVFWISLLLYLSLLAVRKGYLWLWAVLGFILGLSILTRGNAWFFLPGIFLACLFGKQEKKSLNDKSAAKKETKTFFVKAGGILRIPQKKITRKIFAASLIIFCAILPQIPFAFHNSIKLGYFSGPSTAGGAVLALGNTPEAPPGGRNPGLGPGPMEYPDTYNYWMSEEIVIPIHKRIFDWFKREPLAFLELQLRKIILFWDGREIPNNIALEYNGEKSKSLKTFGLIPSSMILALGMSGCFATILQMLKSSSTSKQKLRSSRFLGKSLLLYFIFSFCLATAAFYNLTRFRLPVLPMLAIIGGGFITNVSLAYRLREWKRLVFTLLPCLFAGMFFVLFLFDFYRKQIEPIAMRIARPHGIISKLAHSTLIMDNGTFSFGGWTDIQFNEGDEIVKSFALPEGAVGKNAQIKIPFVFTSPGEAIFIVNDKEIEISSQNAVSFSEIIADIKLASEKISLRLKKSPGPILLFVDNQRNYGRTWLNGYKTGNELVAKIYVMDISP